MLRLKELTVEDLAELIEQKVFELLGDPDSGLVLRNDFKRELRARLQGARKRISHKQVLKKLG